MKLNAILEKEEEYVIYVDLDGVLADLHTYVENLLGRKITTQSDGNWAGDDEIWEELRDREEPHFDKLPLLPDAMKLWNYVKPHHPHILTATGTPYETNAKMKREWVKKHLSGYKAIHTVQQSRLKAEFAAPNHILIDDRTKSTRPWKQAGGIAILHKSAAKTIEELKKLGI